MPSSLVAKKCENIRILDQCSCYINCKTFGMIYLHLIRHSNNRTVIMSFCIQGVAGHLHGPYCETLKTRRLVARTWQGGLRSAWHHSHQQGLRACCCCPSRLTGFSWGRANTRKHTRKSNFNTFENWQFPVLFHL
jgi:hypothetical protein